MAQHHPGEELLLEYASGQMREPLAVLIASHLALCPSCRHEVSELENVGGALLDEVRPTVMRETSFDEVMARIENGDQADKTGFGDGARAGSGEASLASRAGQAPRRAGKSIIVPQPLRGYLGGDLEDLSWKKRSGSVAEVPLLDDFDGFETRLMRISAGAAIPTHTHDGCEYTLVLKGGFSDQFGHYLRGDISVANDDITHQPVADDDGDCFCLAVTDAPLRFTGAMGRLINIINRF